MIEEEMLNMNSKKISTKINILSLSELNSETELIDCNFLLECVYDKDISEDIDFMIENCIEIYSKEEICNDIIDNKIKIIWNYKAKIKLLNDTKFIPYNNIYLIIILVLKNNYCHDCSDLYIENEEAINNNLTRFLNKQMNVIIPKDQCSITYIWTYSPCNTEHIGKYMLIPTLLTIMQQLTHTTKTDSKSGYVGIIATLLCFLHIV